MIITLKGLPKISLNVWYAGTHWRKRKSISDAYKLLVKKQCKFVFPKTKKYHLDFIFFFKKNPLDASNCVAMAKMIEDVLMEDDKHDIVKRISLSSKKSNYDYVTINITELNN